jgi:hypothetical protein
MAPPDMIICRGLCIELGTATIMLFMSMVEPSLPAPRPR